MVSKEKYNHDIKLANESFVFNGRQVVKDTKVKGRYHHLIANSFVEVRDIVTILFKYPLVSVFFGVVGPQGITFALCISVYH